VNLLVTPVQKPGGRYVVDFKILPICETKFSALLIELLKNIAYRSRKQRGGFFLLMKLID